MSERSLERRPAGGEIERASAPPVDGGRLGVYAALGATVSSVPLPWVPGALLRRVRGALVHDIAVRRGASLSGEARDALADPSNPDAPAGTVSRALRFAGKRLALRVRARVGPLRALWPLAQALQLYALGSLFDRYLRAHRPPSGAGAGARIERDEALRVRRAIDGAVARVFDAAPAGAPAPVDADDDRDPATAMGDGLLGAAAGFPAHALRGLDPSFA